MYFAKNGLLLNVASSCSATHSTIFFSSCHRCPSLRARSGFLTALRACLASAESDHDSLENREQVPAPASSYTGVKLQETVKVAKAGKLRLDVRISSQIQGVRRARVQSSIRSGLVSVNGRVVNKVSHNVRAGDMVDCTISELQPLRAEPEDIPVDIVYGDEHVLVVTKPTYMVVHPAPGNASGTLGNAILHHCSLPIVAFPETQLSEGEEVSDNESGSSIACETSTKGFNSSECGASVRPGIVHRLDKVTS